MSGLVNHAALNADNFVVGRWLGAASLGLYSRAYNLMNIPYTYSAVVISPASCFRPSRRCKAIRRA